MSQYAPLKTLIPWKEAQKVLDENLEEVLDLMGEPRGRMQAEHKFKVTRRQLEQWRTLDPQKKLIDQVMRMAADGWVEKAEKTLADVVGDRSVTQAEVTAAKEYANHCRFMSQAMDRKKYGEEPRMQVNQNLTIENLHLDALQRFGSMELAEQNRKLLANVQEAEIIEEDT